MHCNVRPPGPRQPFDALITTSCQVWCRWAYPLPYYSVFAADTLLYDVTLTFDPVTLTLDLEHLQRIACEVMKLCTKFECNRTIRGGDIAISVWPWTCLSVALGSRIIFTKFLISVFSLSVNTGASHVNSICQKYTFALRQLIRDWIIAFYADTLCHAVTLTFDPLTLKFVVHQASRDQYQYKIWAKSSNPRLNYW